MFTLPALNLKAPHAWDKHNSCVSFRWPRWECHTSREGPWGTRDEQLLNMNGCSHHGGAPLSSAPSYSISAVWGTQSQEGLCSDWSHTLFFLWRTPTEAEWQSQGSPSFHLHIKVTKVSRKQLTPSWEIPRKQIKFDEVDSCALSWRSFRNLHPNNTEETTRKRHFLSLGLPLPSV